MSGEKEKYLYIIAQFLMALMDTGLRVGFNRHDKNPFSLIENPQIIGCFSIDTNRDYKASAENLRYFRMPQEFPLDLNKGYGLAKRKQYLDDELLDRVLQFIRDHEDELLPSPDQPRSRGIGDFDFICYRATLRLFMSAPYESKEDWCVHATRYKGNIYLCQKETDKQRQRRLDQLTNLENFNVYGFKFEQFCLTTNPAEEPNTNVPVDECQDFYCIYKYKLKGMNVLYGAGVDGAFGDTAYKNVESKDVLKTIKFVEVACSIKPENEQQQQSFFRYKCRRWWCQCFLAGIKDLIVGYRSDDGLVNEVERMEVRCLPKQAESHWTPSQLGNSLVKILQMIKKLMRDVNCPHTVYEFYFKSSLKVISYRVYGGKSSHNILPDWYIDMLQQRCQSD